MKFRKNNERNIGDPTLSVISPTDNAKLDIHDEKVSMNTTAGFASGVDREFAADSHETEVSVRDRSW